MERGVGGGLHHGHLAVELLHLLVGSLHELLSTRISHHEYKKALFFASMCPVRAHHLLSFHFAPQIGAIQTCDFNLVCEVQSRLLQTRDEFLVLQD